MIGIIAMTGNCPNLVRMLPTVALAAVVVVSSAGGAHAQPSVDRANELASDNDRELATISVNLDEVKKRYSLATAPSISKVERRLRQGEGSLSPERLLAGVRSAARRGR